VSLDDDDDDDDDDDIHMIEKVKGYLFPWCCCKQTHHRPNQHAHIMNGPFCHTTAPANASAGLNTSHQMYLAFWEHARKAEAVAGAAKWCHTACRPRVHVINQKSRLGA
jgi:hypothetical protein